MADGVSWVGVATVTGGDCSDECTEGLLQSAVIIGIVVWLLLLTVFFIILLVLLLSSASAALSSSDQHAEQQVPARSHVPLSLPHADQGGVNLLTAEFAAARRLSA